MKSRTVFIVLIILAMFTAFSFGQGKWQVVEPFSKTPEARYGHSMVYHSHRQVIVLFGGKSLVSGGYLNDTWEYDIRANTWTKMAVDNPPQGRMDFAMVYDSSRRRVVLQGGYQGADEGLRSYSPSTWEWNGRKWVYITGSGPGKLTGHKMVWDSIKNETILFGGVVDNNDGNGNVASRDVWKYKNKRWSRVNTQNTPRERYYHAMAFDEVSGRVVAHSGIHHADRALIDDFSENTFALKNRNWDLIANGGPGFRIFWDLVYDSNGQRLIGFGGTSRKDNGSLKIESDIWTLQNNQWQEYQLAEDSPVPVGRYSHSTVYDPRNDSVWMFGGFPDGELDAKLWKLDLSPEEFLVDLQAKRLAFTPKKLAAGESTTFKFRVRNLGNDSSNGFTLKVYLSRDEFYNVSDKLLNYFSYEELLKPGKSVLVRIETQLPGDLIDGAYYVVGIVETDDEEKDKNNNFILSKKRLIIVN